MSTLRLQVALPSPGPGASTPEPGKAGTAETSMVQTRPRWRRGHPPCVEGEPDLQLQGTRGRLPGLPVAGPPLWERAWGVGSPRRTREARSSPARAGRDRKHPEHPMHPARECVRPHGGASPPRALAKSRRAVDVPRRPLGGRSPTQRVPSCGILGAGEGRADRATDKAQEPWSGMPGSGGREGRRERAGPPFGGDGDVLE